MPESLPIVIPQRLRERFEIAWQHCRVLFFSAPCGCGKTTTARKLLDRFPICARTAEDNACLFEPIPEKSKVFLLDDLQYLKDADDQKALCELIRTEPKRHFVLLSRGGIPGWLMPFQFAGYMEIFEMESLLFDRKAFKELLTAHSITGLAEAEITDILQQGIGHPAGLSIFCRRLAAGESLSTTMMGTVRHEIYRYFDEMVYHKLEDILRRFILSLAPFAQFNVELARMVSGDSRAAEWIERLQQDTSMLVAEGSDHFHFQPFFQQFIQWELEQEFSNEERCNVFRQAGLYYELQNQLRPALDCYTKIGEHSKLSALLIKNAQLHPGIAQYNDLQTYYFSLPREEVLRSPELMAGMSMLCSLCMEYEQSDDWYRELQNYATKLKKSDTQYKEAHGRLVFLDIALPHREISGLMELIPMVLELITSKQIKCPSVCVTGGLPSVMNGGKDFCAWSKMDDMLYATLRKPLEAVLGKEGVGLAHCAICESKFEKDDDYSPPMLTLLTRINEIQRHGTPDMEFAAIGLLARIQITQGNAETALESLSNLREKFVEMNETRFLPNLDAMLCRIWLRLGAVNEWELWYHNAAPKEDYHLWVMWRYQYITKALVQIQMGDYNGALMISRLLPYTKTCARVMDALHIHIIMAICHHRLENKMWKTELHTALTSAWEHRFIQPIAEYGIGILPLLTACGWNQDTEYLHRVITRTRAQTANYPMYLKAAAKLSAPLTTAETQVMKLICHNRSNKEICEIMGTRLPTVKTHVANVLNKLGVDRRTEVKDVAERLHLI